MKRKTKLTAEHPGDKLFEAMPEHCKQVFREHKAHKRSRDRKRYLDAITGKDTVE